MTLLFALFKQASDRNNAETFGPASSLTPAVFPVFIDAHENKRRKWLMWKAHRSISVDVMEKRLGGFL